MAIPNVFSKSYPDSKVSSTWSLVGERMTSWRHCEVTLVTEPYQKHAL